jgi:hypothetical protein
LLLEEYLQKAPRRLVQIDGHQVGEGDDIMPGDEDGHCLTSGATYELRRHAGSHYMPVRAEIYEDADKYEVAALLRKMADWVERGWDDCLSRAGQKRTAEKMRAMLGGEGIGEDKPTNHLRRVK